MQVMLDLSHDDLSDVPVAADVLEVVSYEGAKPYAVVVADLQGAPWFGLIHGASTALLQVL
ncbi:MAG: hypothetical protein ABSE69_20495 [Roseiarcus sp.]